ncbi:Protein kinase domain-containing protein [Mycena indigotica]|uniref:Protein kinase domain-containing protein n=1 Tax=Mycena indigotica TaxID=2126181 RepID=A0A8H6TEV5_9AGAR|nr:Protein kinase domain-containing protein [Mycena indigotica]KAF7315431.1 Protein kinase domain-containing protein [Mycena indigotica]
MPSISFPDPSTVLGNILAQSSAEAASLHGRKAKTPMLAGAIIGSIMGAAYVVGFTIYFYKRWRHKKLKRRIEAGKAPPQPVVEPKERVVIPPDPAVLLGQHKGGEVILVDEKEKRHHHHRQKSNGHVHGNGKGVHGDADGGGSTSHLVEETT